MSRKRYANIELRGESRALVDTAAEILDEYNQQGYNLTLRQLYYQFVARDIIPNNMRSYKRLGDVINNGRMAGMLDWDLLVDRTREEELNNHWTSPVQILSAAAKQYQVDKWLGQPNYVEVWVEKDALSEVIAKPCRELDVTHFSCRGYVSQSSMWRAAMRMLPHDIRHKPTPHVLHLGDHDPSGIDMTRDIEDRLNTFLHGHDSTISVKVERLALNMDQIDTYKPPPNPAKMTDSRVESYISKYGNDSWELDALEPRAIEQLITDAVNKLMDKRLFDKQVKLEKQHKQLLYAAEDYISDRLHE